jgi:two-component system sensor histidine kinase BaeS
MRVTRSLRGVAGRIALAALATSGLALAVEAVGVLVVGASTFQQLMIEHGATAELAHAMFDESVTRVVIVTTLLALFASLGLALALAQAVTRPLDRVAGAARRLAEGNYGVRVDRPAAPELASLADSFNQMASGLGDQERLRRDLISNFAHELRTPLTNLRGYLQALRDGVMPTSAEVFASLDQEVDRLYRLSLSLDELATGEPAAARSGLDSIDLGQVVDAALTLSRPGFDRRGIKVDLAVTAGLRSSANPDHIAQVLLNLFQNAARYTPEGGEVRIRAESDGGSVLVSVTNSGEGIPAVDLPHVFERFYRVEKSRDRARGGAGIGLAVVKQLVEAAGGRVGVESADGLTTFWFSLATA